MEEQAVPNNRWLDRYDNIDALVNLSRRMPTRIQEKIGEYLLSITENYQKKLREHTKFKTLGSKVVLSLYKSKKKQRWYDSVPQIHQALNMMIDMPDPLVNRLNSQCALLVENITAIQSKEKEHPGFMAFKVDLYLKNLPMSDPGDPGSFWIWHQMGEGNPQ